MDSVLRDYMTKSTAGVLAALMIAAIIFATSYYIFSQGPTGSGTKKSKPTPKNKSKNKQKGQTKKNEESKLVPSPIIAKVQDNLEINEVKTAKKVKTKNEKKKPTKKPKKNRITLDFGAAQDESEEEEAAKIEIEPTQELAMNSTKVVTVAAIDDDGAGWRSVGKSKDKPGSGGASVPKNKSEAAKLADDIFDMLDASDAEETAAPIIQMNASRIMLEDLRNNALKAWI